MSRLPTSLRAPLLASLLASLLVTCVVGTRPDGYRPARQPRGVTGHFVLLGTPQRTISAELLAVQDSGYVVHTGTEVGIIPFGAVRRVVFEQLGIMGPSRSGRADQWEQLRYASRFPYGLPAPVLAELLRAAGQSALRNLAAAPGSASVDSAVARFLADARAGTARYRDQEAAVADGFRRVGVDFPAMGEHWVHLQRIMADSFAAAQPSVLTYVRTREGPRLAGVAYTALLETGERVPDFAPARDSWHEHNGSVDDESFPLVPGAPSASRPGEPRLAVLHAWAWVENPAGPFATDNEALPFARLGVVPRAALSPAALGAITLALAGVDYQLLALRAGDPLPAETDAAVERLLRDGAARLAAELAPVRGAADLTDERRQALEARWTALWRDVRAAVPDRASRVDALERGIASAHGAHPATHEGTHER